MYLYFAKYGEATGRFQVSLGAGLWGEIMRPLTTQHTKRVLQIFCSLLLVIAASAIAAQGQSYQGGLRGAAHDASGAVVPGVELILTNQETNTSRSAVTNNEGEYAFANVLPGLYTLTATKGGYKKYEHKAIRVGTQEFITLDVKLEIGQTTESVTISGEPAVLESSNPSIATTLETRALQELPTPARNAFFLSVATPSVVPTGDPQFVRQQDQTNSSLLSLGGGPRRANNYTIDGVSITDLRNRAVFIPNLESVQEVRPATLGFSQNFLSAIPFNKFPVFGIGGYGTVNFDTFGDRDPQDTTFYGHSVNASVSKLLGRHTLKGGFDFRIIGMSLFARGQPSGRFFFDSGFTRGPSPLHSGDNPHALASFLLGFPSSGDITIGTPNDFYINYYAGYAQDDFRVNSKLTLNLGLRYEFEQGLQERDNNMTVGFSRDEAFPVQAPGLNLTGGLLYAGVDGAPTHQGAPSKKKFAPRVGLAYKFSDKVVLRSGYGIFYAPNQYAFPSENNMGTRGFTAVTSYVASTDAGLTPCSTCTLTNPFPNGVENPVGSSLGLRTGVGGDVHFVDQFRKSAYVHQYSADLQYELAGGTVVSAGYVGARSENLSVGGTNSNTVNINQLDRNFLSEGANLFAPVPNPMFGNPAFGALSLPSSCVPNSTANNCIARGQLLRPFPQFKNIFAHQVSAGYARYDSMVLKFERRITRGWGANINYTYSRNKDNLLGEVNYFSNNTNALARALDNNNLEAEFSPSVIEAPHRLNISGVYELPFGKGKKYLDKSGPTDWFLGGWQVAAIGSYQSGFPVVIVQNNTFNLEEFGFLLLRPNLVSGANPKTSGGAEDRLNNWFNPAAWADANPLNGGFGNAPRTDTRARTPIKANWDLASRRRAETIGGSRIEDWVETQNVASLPRR